MGEYGCSVRLYGAVHGCREMRLVRTFDNSTAHERKQYRTKGMTLNFTPLSRNVCSSHCILPGDRVEECVLRKITSLRFPHCVGFDPLHTLMLGEWCMPSYSQRCVLYSNKKPSIVDEGEP